MDYIGNIVNKTPTTPTQASASGVWTLQEAAAATKTNTWPVPGVPNPISKSLRFNSADSAYLNRTLTTPTNNKIFTWSGWVKRGALVDGGAMRVFSANALDSIFFGSYDATEGYIAVYFNSGTSAALISTPRYRDPSAWYHIVVSVDTTQATAANRIKLYVNGSQVTAFGTATYPSQNYNPAFNSAVSHNIGQLSSSQYFSGYMTEINFIDGQALTPSSFGMTDPQTGVWVPIKYTGTYGTNGFYLNFKDATSTTTLGYDYSGNSNNWTTNNFSVTAGSGNDSLTDVPTPWIAYNTGGDVGGVVRGNYATFNALTTTGNTLSNGNLDAVAAATAWRGSFSTIGVSSGKWYMEFNIVGGVYARQIIGIALNSATNSSSFYGYGFISGTQYMGRSVAAIPVDYSSGLLTSLSPTTDFDNGDIAGLCIDADAGKLWVFKNNTIIEGTVGGTANVTWTAGSLVFPVASIYSGDSVYANFGQRPFAYTPPAGYLSLCTTNLPTPTIGATSSTQAGKYFNPVLYTGTGASLSVTGAGFQPDLVWIKSRSNAQDHKLTDAVRGTTKALISNSGAIESTDSNGLTAFGSDGFTVGTDATYNTNNYTYVSWNWKANGSGSSNTSGTITSTVSANATAGFSIVSYTGTGTAGTVGHGLGVAPKMIIVKSRTTTAWDWNVYFYTLTAGNILYLNDTRAEYNGDTNAFTTTAPTSTVFSIGTSSQTNNNTTTYIAYCFAPVAGYSAFGSYTGNGSSDGPFVYTGFRPRWILLKRTDSSSGGDWLLLDTARNTYNVMNYQLLPNSSVAEYNTYSLIDVTANGFKWRYTDAGWNTNGSTWIYAAFAESPFKYANAR